MTNPIDVINAAVFAADPHGRLGPGAIARVVVETLPADDIVSNAAHALFEDPAADGKTWEQCEQIARTVLHSVSDA